MRLPLLLLLACSVSACGEPAAPAGPAALEVVSGDQQESLFFLPLAQPLVVRVKNRSGSPLAGVTVKWNPSTGRVVPAESITDAAGLASTHWTFGTADGRFIIGAHFVAANVPGLMPVLFTAFARRGAAVGAITISPAEVNVALAPATVTLAVQAEDDFQNITALAAEFRGPSGAASVGFFPLDLVSGTPRNGTWRGAFQLPQGAEPGTWVINVLRIRSGEHTLTHFASSLQAAGLPYQLSVTRGPNP